MWFCAIQLRKTASVSNIEILQRFQAKVIKTIINTPWSVTNDIIHQNIKVPAVREVAKGESLKYLSRFDVLQIIYTMFKSRSSDVNKWAQRHYHVMDGIWTRLD